MFTPHTPPISAKQALVPPKHSGIYLTDLGTVFLQYFSLISLHGNRICAKLCRNAKYCLKDKQQRSILKTMIFLPLTMLCEIAVHINNNSRLRPIILPFHTYLLKLCFTQTRQLLFRIRQNYLIKRKNPT